HVISRPVQLTCSPHPEHRCSTKCGPSLGHRSRQSDLHRGQTLRSDCSRSLVSVSRNRSLIDLNLSLFRRGWASETRPYFGCWSSYLDGLWKHRLRVLGEAQRAGCPECGPDFPKVEFVDNAVPGVSSCAGRQTAFKKSLNFQKGTQNNATPSPRI